MHQETSAGGARHTEDWTGPTDPFVAASAWPLWAAYRGWQSAVDGSYRVGSASMDLLRRSATFPLRGLDPFASADFPTAPSVRIPLGPPSNAAGTADVDRRTDVAESSVPPVADIAPAGVVGPATTPPAGDAFDAFLAAFEADLPTHPVAME